MYTAVHLETYFCDLTTEQDRGRVLPEPRAVVPRGEHRLRRAEQRGHQEA